MGLLATTMTHNLINMIKDIFYENISSRKVAQSRITNLPMYKILENSHNPEQMKRFLANCQSIVDEFFPQRVCLPKGFNKVAGMHDLKQQLLDDIVNPLLNPKLYKKYGIDQTNGCLLFGPPGCGKTFIANALAEETNRPLFEITPSNVGSQWQHETAINIRNKFILAEGFDKSIVFIDEAEALLPSREFSSRYAENVSEVLRNMNNSKKKNIFVILASNEPQKIDPAIKRTGRVDKKIYVGPPDVEARKELIKNKLNGIYKVCNIDYKKLALATNNYIAEDIRMVLRRAGLKAMKENSMITENHILEAISTVKPSLSESLIQSYKNKGDM